MDKATGRKLIPLAALGIILLLANTQVGVHGYDPNPYSALCLDSGLTLFGYAGVGCRLFLWTILPGTLGTIVLAIVAWIYNDRRKS